MISRIFVKSWKSDFRKFWGVGIFFWKIFFVVLIFTTTFFFQKKIPAPQNIRKLDFESKNWIWRISPMTSWYPNITGSVPIFRLKNGLWRHFRDRCRRKNTHFSFLLPREVIWNTFKVIWQYIWEIRGYCHFWWFFHDFLQISYKYYVFLSILHFFHVQKQQQKNTKCLIFS